MPKNTGDLDDLLTRPRRRQLRKDPLGGAPTLLVVLVAFLIVAGLTTLLTACGPGGFVWTVPAEPAKTTPVPSADAPVITARPRPVRTPPTVTRKPRPVNPSPSLPTATFTGR